MYWTHPTYGLVMPKGSFIAISDWTGIETMDEIRYVRMSSSADCSHTSCLGRRS